MDIFEIAGNATGVSRAGVNFLQPADSYQSLVNGFIYRQILQSRQGASLFAPRLAGATRVYSIFEHILPNDTKKLLVFDKNFCYLYNTATQVFDQVPFGGSMAAYTGFNMSTKDDYISCTDYPTALNAGRVVFTSPAITPSAGSSVFFYDDTTNTVRDFTSLADNPNYQPPLVGGVPTALNSARYVIWFGERLNFAAPTVGGITYNQQFLYSGIRTNSGNGDKFAVAGSGNLSGDTSEEIRGCSVLGQVILLNFSASAYSIEKTKDAFNPYFIRKIPSVEGTTAGFSAVSWYDKVKSMGRTGILSTDGRQSLKADNKIPYFTQDEIEPSLFNYTYGGFDRFNNQFLWTYVEAGSEETTQNKILVNNYEENTWSTYDQRFTVFGSTDVGVNLNWDDIDETHDPSWATWDTTENIWDKIGIGASVQKTLAGDDLGFIYQLNQDFDDYITNITNITQATQAVLTVDASAFQVGDRVVVENVQGMTEINNYDPDTSEMLGYIYTIVAASTTSITLDVDSQLFTAYTPNTGTISKVISFSATTIPFNPYREQGRKVVISHIEFLIDNLGGSLLVDVFADEEPTPFKANILLKPDVASTKPRQWITMIVNNEANFMTIAMKQESPAAQLRITSMRIHCEAGGYTSG